MIRRRRARRAPPRALFDGPRQHDDLAARGAAPARTLASVALTSASVRSIARKPPISTRSRARCDSSACLAQKGARDRACLSARRRPRLGQRAREREQHRPLASDTIVPADARRDDRRRRRARSTPATASTSSSRSSRSSPLRDQARGGRLRGRARRRRPPRSAPESAPGARPARRVRARSRAAFVAHASHRNAGDDQFVDGPQRGRQVVPGRARRAYARPRRVARSGAAGAPRDGAHARRSRDRRALRASPAPRRAPSPASPGRARPARSRLRRRHSGRAPRLLARRTRARLCAAASSRARDRRAAPSRCRAARAPAHRRASATRFNAPRIAGRECARRRRDQRVHRNPVTLVTPTIPCARRSIYLTTSERAACNGAH